MKSSEALRYLDELKIGIDELQWLQGGYEARGVRGVLEATSRPGFIVRHRPNTGPDYPWLVADGGGNGRLCLYGGFHVQSWSPDSDKNTTTLLAITPDGYVVEWEGVPYGTGIAPPTATPIRDASNVVIEVPDDNTWRTLVMRRISTTLEKGSLQVTAGSAVVVGTSTEFTRYSGFTTDGYDRGTNIRIDVADTIAGNQGTYEVDTVTDDTHLTLRTPVGGGNESGIRFRVAGDFASSVPADPDIHLRYLACFALVTRTREPPSPNDLILADVRLNTAVSAAVQIIDRRSRNIWLPRYSKGSRRSLRVHPEIVFDPASPYVAATLNVANICNSATVAATKASLMRGADRTELLCLWDDTGTAIRCRRLQKETWAALSNVDTSGTASDPCGVKVPAETGNTHHGFYIKADKLYQRASTDDGTTWGAESCIWDPTAVDPNDKLEHPDAILLLNHRLVIVAGYFDDSAAGGAGQKQIRWIYSDDYGATWETNANAGQTFISNYHMGMGMTYYDSTRPNIWQAEDGWIVVAFDDDDNSVLWTDSFYDYTLGHIPYGTTGFWGTAALCPHDKAKEPVIFADSFHNVFVVYRCWDNGAHHELRIAYFDSGVGTDDRRLFTVEQAPAGEEDIGPDFEFKEGDGTLHLVYTTTPLGTPGLAEVKCDLLYGPIEHRWRE